MVRVTEIGHSFSAPIGVHEVGHQLAGDHDKSFCWCNMHKISWSWGCWCYKFDGCAMELCTTMNPSIRTSTGHVIRMIFSDANKAEARTVSGYANRQHDTVTWKHCANENGICQCDGTVRYGALGTAVEWDDLGAGGCVASNGQLYNRYVLVTGQYGFSGTVDSCKQLCANHNECVGINFVPGYNHCHLNVGSGVTLSGVGWNIHGGAGNGQIAGSTGSHTWNGFWSCSRANRAGKWSSPTPVRGQIACTTGSFGVDPYPGVVKSCECTSLEWEALGAGGCLSKEGSFYRRHVLVTGQYGFSGTVQSCKQLCAKHSNCVGINFVNFHNHCHLNLGDGVNIAGVGWNIHAGSGTGPISRAAGSGNWECHRVVNNF